MWHSLIDRRKLPYMATVRNLRNLVLSNVDDAHAAAVAEYVGNERAVANSRMFPFRFFVAFDVLDELQEWHAQGGRMVVGKDKKKVKKSLKVIVCFFVCLFVCGGKDERSIINE